MNVFVSNQHVCCWMSMRTFWPQTILPKTRTVISVCRENACHYVESGTISDVNQGIAILDFCFAVGLSSQNAFARFYNLKIPPFSHRHVLSVQGKTAEQPLDEIRGHAPLWCVPTWSCRPTCGTIARTNSYWICKTDALMTAFCVPVVLRHYLPCFCVYNLVFPQVMLDAMLICLS